jgi:hypothetical protein
MQNRRSKEIGGWIMFGNLERSVGYDRAASSGKMGIFMILRQQEQREQYNPRRS